MSQQTKINGNRYGFTSISVEAGNYSAPKGVFEAINYTATQDPGVVQGNAVEVTGLTAGYGVGAGDMTMLLSESDDLIASLTQNGARPIMSVDFDIIVAYAENDVDVRVDTLRGCRITEVGNPNQKGNDGSTRTFKLFIRKPLLNGIAAFADPAQ